ncbi:MAG: hypothetical protein QNJ47_00760 [Nostocaceae cyanobacterium]|nr:hypothetical protein [Nostocaceae cyanobacterium]
MKRQILALGLIAASTVGTIGLATSAQAASLTIPTLHCEGTGGGRFTCFARAAGGNGSYKFSWNTGRNASLTKQTNNGASSFISDLPLKIVREQQQVVPHPSSVLL